MSVAVGPCVTALAAACSTAGDSGKKFATANLLGHYCLLLKPALADSA